MNEKLIKEAENSKINLKLTNCLDGAKELLNEILFSLK
jgi:hypothetical protein